MIYRGTVTGTTSQGVWVRIPSLTGGADLGPLPSVPVDLLPGEGVLVTPVGGSLDDLLVLSRADEYYIAAAIAAALEAGLVAERLPVILVGSTTDLNDYVDNRTYHQNANAAATTGFNYPVAKAGLLEVRSAASMVYQRYTEYNTGTIWTRSKYATTWYGWKKTPDSTLATAAIDGLMPKADKAKLDAAAVSATANTLVLRAASGRFDATDPAVSTNVSTKGYTDTGDASTLASGKTYADSGDAATLASAQAYAAPVSHTHSYANITGLVPTSALPPLAVVETYTAATQAAMLALTAQRGDMCIRTDSVRTYVLTADTPSVLAAWKEITAAGQVTSVASKTGTVLLVKADVGLGSVDNTADTAKPVSTATQTALNLKANSASPTFTGTVTAPTIRLTNTGDASETSTGHAFQVGDDSGTNLIVDNNEIIGRNNGALSAVFMPSGISSLPAPVSASSAANKGYVDAQAANRLSWLAVTGWTFVGGLLLHPTPDGNFGALVDLTIIRTGTAVGLTTGWTIIGSMVPAAGQDAEIGIKYFSCFFSGVEAVYGYVHFGNGDVGLRAGSGTVSLTTNSTTTLSGAAVRAS